MKLFIVSFIFNITVSSALANCTLPAEEHPQQNIGYEVGEGCSKVTIVGSASTRLQFIGSKNKECTVLSQTQSNTQSVLVLSMDASKENSLGAGCRVKTTFANGHSRILSFSAYED